MMLKFREVSGQGRKMPAAGLSRRALCALLSLCMLLSLVCFAACGEQPLPDGGKPSAASSGGGSSSGGTGDSGDLDSAGGEPPVTFVYRSPEETLAMLPDYSMDGALVIAVDKRCEELLGAHPMLSSSFESVKVAIKARYGAEGFFQSYSGAEMLAKSKEAVAGGEFFADILAIPLSELPRYLSEDLLMPISALNGLSSLAVERSADAGEADKSGAGIFFDSTRELAVNGECYALLGSGALSQMGSVCLLFNHTLLDTLLPEGNDLYSAVKEGNWTWELLLSLLSAAQASMDIDATSIDTDAASIDADSASMNADSAASEGTDGNTAAMAAYAGETISLFGTTLSEDAFRAAVYKSFDTTLSEDAAEGSFYLSAIEALQVLSQQEMPSGSAAENAFREGELLFLVTTLDALYEYPNSDGSWGCLPLPKRNEEAAGYISMLDPESTCVYVVLKNSLREETKGGYLLALNAAAEYACLPSFSYELLSDYIREGASLEMLPYILAGVAAEKALTASALTASALTATEGADALAKLYSFIDSYTAAASEVPVAAATSGETLSSGE